MRIYLEDELPRLLVPMRLDVFGTRQSSHKRPRPIQVGWQGWNPDPVMERTQARLRGSGSFYWQGGINALVAAKRMLRDDTTIQQIKIETISGREVGRIYR